jgi:hypothetical protein
MFPGNSREEGEHAALAGGDRRDLALGRLGADRPHALRHSRLDGHPEHRASPLERRRGARRRVGAAVVPVAPLDPTRGPATLAVERGAAVHLRSALVPPHEPTRAVHRCKLLGRHCFTGAADEATVAPCLHDPWDASIRVLPQVLDALAQLCAGYLAALRRGARRRGGRIPLLGHYDAEASTKLRAGDVKLNRSRWK